MLRSELKKIISSLIMIGFEGSELHEDHPLRQTLTTYPLGGVILFNHYMTQSNEIKPKNIIDFIQIQKLTQDLQNAAQRKLLIACDIEGGEVNRLSSFPEAKNFPSAKSISEMSDLDAQKAYRTMAEFIKKTGINCNFGPCLDFDNPICTIISGKKRSYGNTSASIIRGASFFLEAMENAGLVTSLKHFPGHGNTPFDSHNEIVDITEKWDHNELEPYKELLKNFSKTTLVMTGHLINRKLDETGKPATLSKPILSILRNELHFNGIIISDDLQMAAIAETYDLETQLIETFNAGVDMLLVCNQCGDTRMSVEDLVDTIFHLTKAGKIKESDLLQAYDRIETLHQNW